MSFTMLKKSFPIFEKFSSPLPFMRQYALFLAAAVLIGHAGVIVIGGPAIVMCGFDIVCLTTSLRAFPITGVLPDFAFEDLQLLNRATGMTGNAVGGVSGYVLVCAATAICVLLRSDPVRTRVFAAATATSAVTAVAAVSLVMPASAGVKPIVIER